MERRTFVKNAALASAGFAILPAGSFFAETTIKIGIIGVGLRGQNHLELALRRKDVEVVAICDIDEQMLQRSEILLRSLTSQCQKFSKEIRYAWRKLLEIKEIDGIIIATPWEWHAPMCIESLEAGKYVGTEVCLGITLEDHWNVVKTCERYKGNLMMLENVCYSRDVMAVLNMVRQGVFGELIHMQAGYQHDLRSIKLNNGKQASGGGVEFGEKAFSEARWRTNHSYIAMVIYILPMALGL